MRYLTGIYLTEGVDRTLGPPRGLRGGPDIDPHTVSRLLV